MPVGRYGSEVAAVGPFNLDHTRPEIGELHEGAASGRGGSSTMPQKQNPVLAVLVRRAAIAAPPLGATLHEIIGRCAGLGGVPGPDASCRLWPPVDPVGPLTSPAVAVRILPVAVAVWWWAAASCSH